HNPASFDRKAKLVWGPDPYFDSLAEVRQEFAQIALTRHLTVDIKAEEWEIVNFLHELIRTGNLLLQVKVTAYRLDLIRSGNKISRLPVPSPVKSVFKSIPGVDTQDLLVFPNEVESVSLPDVKVVDIIPNYGETRDTVTYVVNFESTR